MPQSDLEERLTPAAREALDELLADYRKQIILGAQDSANSPEDAREISVRDVMAGLDSLQTGEKGRVPSTLSRILSLYTLTGLVIGIGGAWLFLYKQIAQSHDLRGQLPLAVALAGFSFSALSYSFLRLRSRRVAFYRPSLRSSAAPQLRPDVALFIAQWRDLELALRDASSAQLGESAAAAPISVLVERLVHDGQLTMTDARRMKELLRVRNEILHRGREADSDALVLAIRDAGRITARLRSLSMAAS